MKRRGKLYLLKNNPKLMEKCKSNIIMKNIQKMKMYNLKKLLF